MWHHERSPAADTYPKSAAFAGNDSPLPSDASPVDDPFGPAVRMPSEKIRTILPAWNDEVHQKDPPDVMLPAVTDASDSHVLVQFQPASADTDPQIPQSLRSDSGPLIRGENTPGLVSPFTTDVPRGNDGLTDSPRMPELQGTLEPSLLEDSPKPVIVVLANHPLMDPDLGPWRASLEELLKEHPTGTILGFIEFANGTKEINDTLERARNGGVSYMDILPHALFDQTYPKGSKERQAMEAQFGVDGSELGVNPAPFLASAARIADELGMQYTTPGNKNRISLQGEQLSYKLRKQSTVAADETYAKSFGSVWTLQSVRQTIEHGGDFQRARNAEDARFLSVKLADASYKGAVYGAGPYHTAVGHLLDSQKHASGKSKFKVQTHFSQRADKRTVYFDPINTLMRTREFGQPITDDDIRLALRAQRFVTHGTVMGMRIRPLSEEQIARDYQVNAKRAHEWIRGQKTKQQKHPRREKLKGALRSFVSGS